MFLYYQDIGVNGELELVDEFSNLDDLMLKIEEQCNDGHNEYPSFIPTFNEYVSNDFSNYDNEYTYLFKYPTLDEINSLGKNKYITIIKDDIKYEKHIYLVSKYEI